jgi:hypothetical protein
MFIDSHAARAFCPVLLARYIIHQTRFKGQINIIITLIIMPCKSPNLECTANLYAKTEVTSTISMAVFKFVN